MYKLLLIIFCYSFISFSQISDTVLTNYKWKGIGDYKAELLVPINFQESHNYYGEGLYTILQYQDSSYIFLHIGGVMTLPFFDQKDDSNIVVVGSLKKENKVIRKGITKDKKYLWREDSLIGGWINIGYKLVSLEEIKLFEESLDSFIAIKK